MAEKNGQQNHGVTGSRRSTRKAPLVIILVSLVLLAAGIAFGEPARVLEQAVQICLGCIGIG